MNKPKYQQMRVNRCLKPWILENRSTLIKPAWVSNLLSTTTFVNCVYTIKSNQPTIMGVALCHEMVRCP
jgi:hypothetical protein